ncbi:MAG TPA: 3-hydroxyacyl-CoA dehydrogenase NAD-binding domain-containing protein [Gaiellaceae bacterium]
MSGWGWEPRSSGRTSLPETEFKLARIALPNGRALALVTIDNGEDHTKPTFFGRAALESLELLLPRLEEEDWAALVLTGKPYVFAAGADITEFPNATRDLAIAGSRAGHELFRRIRALPYPTVAAVNGACLGGGVELALHCDARTISTAVRHFACPECFLGIVPAWGGTQLVPRLVGAETAVKFIVANPMRQNRVLTGPQAFELGFADRLLEPAEFLDESIAFALERAAEGTGPGVRPPDMAETDVFRKARARLDDQVHAAAPAPYKALDLIEGACSGWSFEEGYLAEEEAVGELLPGPQAQASLYAFDLVERRAKSAPGRPDAEPRPIRKVGIVGAGLMAAQLATLVLRRLEVPIAMRDLSEEALASATGTIRSELEEQVTKGRYEEGKARFLASLVSTSAGYEHFADCDLVLEAVFEELETKKQVFAELREHTTPEAVLATNTSSLSVAEMGADVGIHFFNPVALLPLVELVHTPDTDDRALATAWAFAEQLRKRPVLVQDAPAFVVNRLLTRLMAVVLEALERGTDPDEADEAILRLGLPMAPSVLLQMVGPRVANHVLETLHAAYPDRFLLSQTLANYAEGRDEIAVRERRPQSRDEILETALEAIADEIRHLLEEGVVADAKDVDTALLLGAGWPFWLGGITRHLDQTGISEKMLGRPLAEIGVGAPTA